MITNADPQQIPYSGDPWKVRTQTIMGMEGEGCCPLLVYKEPTTTPVLDLRNRATCNNCQDTHCKPVSGGAWWSWWWCIHGGCFQYASTLRSLPVYDDGYARNVHAPSAPSYPLTGCWWWSFVLTIVDLFAEHTDTVDNGLYTLDDIVHGGSGPLGWCLDAHVRHGQRGRRLQWTTGQQRNGTLVEVRLQSEPANQQVASNPVRWWWCITILVLARATFRIRCWFDVVSILAQICLGQFGVETVEATRTDVLAHQQAYQTILLRW